MAQEGDGFQNSVWEAIVCMGYTTIPSDQLLQQAYVMCFLIALQVRH